MNNNLQILIIEPQNHEDYFPFSDTHCIWEIRSGALRLFEKIQYLYPHANIAFDGRRNYIKSFFAKNNENKFINNVKNGIPTLGIISSFIFDIGAKKQIEQAIAGKNRIAFYAENKLIAFYDNNFKTNEQWNFDAQDYENKIELINISSINYIWDVLKYQKAQISEDANLLKFNRITDKYNNIYIKNPDNIFIGSNVEIGFNVVLDATDGTIIIDDNAKIMHNSTIIGDCYIGKNTTIKIGAKIYNNCSFGENCKIGGELESTIFHAFSNKQHDGFMGNSYIGEWVNFGANTNNSDLKNNYSKIKIQLPNKIIETNELFLGLMCGDHVKAAIGTLFATGSAVGTASMLASNKFIPKFIPNFTWLVDNKIGDYDFEKAINTAQNVMQRRNKNITQEEIKILNHLFMKKKS